MGKVDKRIIKSKRSIKNAFLDLLNQKEFAKITVSELARRAEVDRKTFYLHYNNTSELLKEFENDLLERAKRQLFEIEDFDVKQMLRIFNGILEDNKSFFKSMSKFGVNTFFLSRCEGIVVELLTMKLKIGNAIDVEKKYHLKFVATGVLAVYIDWLNAPQDLGLNQLSEIIERLISVHRKSVCD